jgi:hypothetical protein
MPSMSGSGARDSLSGAAVVPQIICPAISRIASSVMCEGLSD